MPFTLLLGYPIGVPGNCLQGAQVKYRDGAMRPLDKFAFLHSTD